MDKRRILYPIVRLLYGFISQAGRNSITGRTRVLYITDEINASE